MSLINHSAIATGAGDDAVYFPAEPFTLDLAVDGGAGTDTLEMRGATISGRFDTTSFETVR